MLNKTTGNINVITQGERKMDIESEMIEIKKNEKCTYNYISKTMLNFIIVVLAAALEIYSFVNKSAPFQFGLTILETSG